MPKLIILVGPPGCGKSTLSKEYETKMFRTISQDDMGKNEHINEFNSSLFKGLNVVVDRMNFNKQQRDRYLNLAKSLGYETEIIVIHESKDTCMKRCSERTDHPTVKTKEDASKSLHFFFKSYERVEDNEADKVTRIWPEEKKEKIIICDLDGTLCNVDHRHHLVNNIGNIDDKKNQKKNWPLFFKELKNDSVNKWCRDIIWNFDIGQQIKTIFCSGRPDDYKKETEKWLLDNSMIYDHLFMRQRGDYRADTIIKEVILDFEILTRYEPYFAIDDRSCVVEMWRSRGITTLACAKGDF